MAVLLCICLLGILAIGGSNCDHDCQTRRVIIDQGPVIGRKDDRADIFNFYNIPYAKAPTGVNKFMAPLPPPTWKEPFDAVNRRIICPQINSPLKTSDKTMQEQEDCLVTSVYVPDTKDVNLPVYVYVHGGGFQIGFGDGMTFREMMKTKDFILVTFNYRLGVHGFLCLGTEKTQGNAGMKDQVALLRWVKRNIAAFGGNPDDVTIGGGSAGAAAVDLLLLSQSARGLFNRVIAESGSALAAFSLQSDPIEMAQNYAKLLNFTEYNDIYALENFFTTASYDFLVSLPFEFAPDAKVGISLCVERPAGEEIFIDDSPLNILKSGNYKNVPLLYGFADFEGIIMGGLFGHWSKLMNEQFSIFLPADLKFETEEEKEKLAQKIKAFYFGKNPVDVNSIQAYVEYYSDIMFTYPALKSLELQRLHGNDKIYLYEFSYYEGEGTRVGYKDYMLKGANHCGQSMAVFDGSFLYEGGEFEIFEESTLSDEYKGIKATTREMWQNFIKLGVPVPPGSSLPAWPPMGEAWSPHMSLGRVVELRGSLLEERARFWDDIYQLYYRNPVPPPSPPARHQEL
ncbi:juvenile hormone esterase-like [Plodia interpunctella]|uniref:juvenile hormone esterase-like n=1 Tax=Plodia interpunctella TaxID=58824 RepID=UPI00236874CA|nr:juvenile hormone esterase-like [Plodia interpunctella]